MDIGTEVWVKDAATVWAPGVVLDCQDMHTTGIIKAKLETGEIVARRYISRACANDLESEVFVRNVSCDFVRMPCLTGLDYLHEPELLHALSERFAHDQIYTSIGDILLAINPFKSLEVYSDATIEQYKQALKSSAGVVTMGGDGKAVLPHVFAIAAKAYSGLLKPQAVNQAILVSGESGSGKTESTKFLMKFLTSVGQDASREASHAAAGDVVAIGKRILQTNPILESFGNARTIRNDNSSRFGKFIKIQFDAEHQIVGAEILSYLLEKVRLIHQSTDERNFHIFYELLEGGDAELLEHLGLERGAKYELLNAYGAPPVKRGRRPVANPLAVQYSKRFPETVQAFEDTGVLDDERAMIFEILGALLHLGNVNFEVPSAVLGASPDVAAVANSSLDHLQKCAQLLGVDTNKLESLLITREITAGNEILKLKLDADQSKHASRSLAKEIYGRLFVWLVGRLSDGINCRDYIPPGEEDGMQEIGILDIFGFESLEQNGFEQMCINYANERLQAQFNEFVFVKEQEVYASEGIDWSSISYPSNAACLGLFDDRTSGIFSLLDQECLMPKGSDKALSTKFYRYHGAVDEANDRNRVARQLSQNFAIPILSFGKYLQSDDKDDLDAQSSAPFSASKMDRVNQQFLVRHFAGKVRYHIHQFLEKNQDALPRDATSLLATSSNEIVAEICLEDELTSPPANGQRNRSKSVLRAPSVSAQFRGQLDQLLEEIGHTEAHYVRCLKPNENKKAREFNRHRMVEQLRSVGVLEALRIARAGYATRLAHHTFIDTFSCFRRQLDKLGVDTKVMKKRALSRALLAIILTDAIEGSSVSLAPIRTLLNMDDAEFNTCARPFGVQFGLTTVFFKASTYNDLFHLRLDIRADAAIDLQRIARGYRCRKHYNEMKRSAISIQAIVRGHQARVFVARLRALSRRVAASKIQRSMRTALAWKHRARQLRERVAAYSIQVCMRRALERLHEMDETARLHRLRVVFKCFCEGVAMSQKQMLNEPMIRLSVVNCPVEDDAATDLQSCGGIDEESASDDGLPKQSNRRGTAARMQRSDSSLSRKKRRGRASSEDPSERGQTLEDEIARLQRLLAEKQGSSRVSSSHGRGSSGNTGSRADGRRSFSVDEMEPSDADDEYDSSEPALHQPRRSRSVFQTRELTHVSRLTRRIEELDAKCRMLEQLVSRAPPPYHDPNRQMMPGYPPFYPPPRSSSLPWDHRRRRPSFASSDAGSMYGEYSQYEGAPSNPAVDGLIQNIQQQMDMLRQSVAIKTEEEAALQARRHAHTMSLASSHQTRSSTGTSFDGAIHEDEIGEEGEPLPSPTRTNSQLQGSVASGDGAMSLQNSPVMAGTPDSTSFFMQPPRSAPAQFERLPGPPMTPGIGVVKWTRGTHCHECQEPFTIFVRRHHCRLCGNSFCHEHSSRRLKLPALGFDEEAVRVCDSCFASGYAYAAEATTPMSMAAPSPAYYPYHLTSPYPQYPQPSPYHQYGYHPQYDHGMPPQRYPSYYGNAAPPPPPSNASAA